MVSPSTSPTPVAPRLREPPRALERVRNGQPCRRASSKHVRRESPLQRCCPWVGIERRETPRSDRPVRRTLPARRRRPRTLLVVPLWRVLPFQPLDTFQPGGHAPAPCIRSQVAPNERRRPSLGGLWPRNRREASRCLPATSPTPRGRRLRGPRRDLCSSRRGEASPLGACRVARTAETRRTLRSPCRD